MRADLVAGALGFSGHLQQEFYFLGPFVRLLSCKRQQQWGICYINSERWLDISPGNIIPGWVAVNLIALAIQ